MVRNNQSASSTLPTSPRIAINCQQRSITRSHCETGMSSLLWTAPSLRLEHDFISIIHQRELSFYLLPRFSILSTQTLEKHNAFDNTPPQHSNTVHNGLWTPIANTRCTFQSHTVKECLRVWERPFHYLIEMRSHFILYGLDSYCRHRTDIT